MSEARRQRRAFKRAYDKATKQYKVPIITNPSVFDDIPVGNRFRETLTTLLTQAEDYEVTTSSK